MNYRKGKSHSKQTECEIQLGNSGQYSKMDLGDPDKTVSVSCSLDVAELNDGKLAIVS